MIIINNINELRIFIKNNKTQGKTIGLVPTMGFLHEGHKSLIEKAVSENDIVVVSDFVNPTQFGPTEDLSSYPRNLDRDAQLCDNAKATVLFTPDAKDIYFEDATTFVNMSGLTEDLCGKTRPIHFRGVCTIVSKLFNIVTPDRAYFGQKDAQQVAVIKRMVRDLNYDIKIVVCPIIREIDGLAKSSRNTYLNEKERKAALILYKAIILAKELIKNGQNDIKTILSDMVTLIEKEPLAKIDYVKAVDASTITTRHTLCDNTLFAMAVYIGKTRLIDNFIYHK